MDKKFIVYCFDDRDKLYFEHIDGLSFVCARNKAYKMGYKLCTDYSGCKDHLDVINRRKKKWHTGAISIMKKKKRKNQSKKNFTSTYIQYFQLFKLL